MSNNEKISVLDLFAGIKAFEHPVFTMDRKQVDKIFQEYGEEIDELLNAYNFIAGNSEELKKFLKHFNISKEQFDNLSFREEFPQMYNEYTGENKLKIKISENIKHDNEITSTQVKCITDSETTALIKANIDHLHTPPINTGTSKYYYDNNVSIFFDNTVFTTSKNSSKSVLRQSAQKLLTYCIILLTRQISVKSHTEYEINPTILIDVQEYAKLCKHDISTKTKRDNFLKYMNDDFDMLEKPYIEDSRTRVNSTHRIISSRQSNKDKTITVNFDVSFAKAMTQANLMYFYIPLLELDNKHPIGYKAGFKILQHASNYSNIIRNTNNTLTVDTFLEFIPELYTVQDYELSNRRKWRKDIKEKLENGLNENVKIGLLQKWEYRNVNNETISSEDANKLNLLEYSNLRIDYVTNLNIDADAVSKYEKKKERRNSRKKKS